MMYAHSARKQEVGGDGHAGQRGSFVGIEGKQEVCNAVQMCTSKEEAKK